MSSFLYGDTGNHVATTDLSAATVTFYRIDSPSTVTTSYPYTGFPIMPGPVVVLGQVTLTPDADYRLEFYNNVDFGTAVCKVIGKGRYVGEVSASFSINRSIADASVTVYPLSYDYTGSQITPTSVTVVYYDGSTLTEGVDYALTYSSAVNAGEAAVTITGINHFSGSKSAPYFVSRKDLNTAAITLPSEYDTYHTYDGNAFTPTPTVYMGSTLLVVNTDYVVSYSNNINPGQASVVVEGRGNYKGTKIANFVIKGDLGSGGSPSQYVSTTWAVSGKSFTFSDDYITPQLSVKFASLSDSLSSTSDISLSYANNKNAAAPSAVNPPTVTVTAREGSYYYGSFSETFTIVAKSISAAYIELSQTDYPYLGYPVTPEVEEVSVSFGEYRAQLVEDTDFSVAYQNNDQTDTTATVVITGLGNYSGSASTTFGIRSAKLSDAVITLADFSYEYDGTQKCPTATSVVLYGVTLTAGTDYSITYENNINAGNDTATIRFSPAAGNRYSAVSLGDATRNFSIAARSITNATLTVTGGPFVYTGEEICPTVSVLDNDISSDPLTASDYTVSYTGNVNANTWEGSENVAYAVATGKGNYTGSLSSSFAISPRSIATATATFPYAKYLYTGSAIEPSGMLVTLSQAGGLITIPSADYSVSYSDNTAIGTASVVITGQQNCTGSISTTFPIVSRDMSNVLVSFVDGVTSYVYNGTYVTPEYVVDGGSFILIAGRDFTATWENNDRPGNTARLKLVAIDSALDSGHGGMSGFTFAYFQITAMPLAGKVNVVFDSAAKSASVQAYKYYCDYDSEAGGLSGQAGAASLCPEGPVYVLQSDGYAKPSITATLKDVENGGITFVEGTDYDVEYIDNDEPGDATLKIVAKSGSGLPNRYSGFSSFSFTVRKDFSELSVSTLPSVPYNASRTSLYGILSAATFSYSGDDVTAGYVSDDEYKNLLLYEDNTFLLLGDSEEVRSSASGYTMTYGLAMYRLPGPNVGTYQIDLYPHMAVDSVYSNENSDVPDQEYRGLVSFLPKYVGDGLEYHNAAGFSGWRFNRTFAGKRSVSVTVSSVDISTLLEDEDTSPLTTNRPFRITSLGSEVRPGIVMLNSQASDYTCTYSNNTAPGTATVTLTAAASPGNLYGSVSKTFQIYLSDSVVSLAATDVSFTGSQLKPAVVIDVDGGSFSLGTDYVVEYGSNNSVGTGSVTVSGPLFVAPFGRSFNIVTGIFNSSEKYVIHSLDASGSQVDTTVTGVNPHISVSLSAYCFISDGATEHEPSVIVTYDGVALSRWTDYYMYYINTKSEGEGYVAVVGTGGFSGEIKNTVVILPAAFSDYDLSGYYTGHPELPYTTITGIESKTYTGSPVTQTFTLMFVGNVLRSGTDYTVSYSDNTNVGTATITITGAGDYTGSITKNFTITY